LLLLAVPLFAVTPVFWEIRTYDEFRQGKLTNLSLTSDGHLILAPRFDAVFNTDQPVIWAAVTDSKGNVYLGAGHEGKVFRVDPSGKGDLVVDLQELDVLALAVDSKDVLYAATSPDGKVYRIESGKPQTFFDPDAKYIWSMAFDRQGRLIVGSGDNGVIYRVYPDGKSESFYDTDETHVISLAVDRDGNVIAGGDPKGYIYRISPEGKAFVLYDSGMREVHAIAAADDGRIYAAVLNGAGPLAIPSGPASDGNRPASVPGPTVTVTVGPAESAAQNVEVTAPADAPSPDGATRAAPRRPSTDSSSQSVILEVLPNGTVNTLLRLRDEMIYSILPHGGRLLFSTGAKGRIYALETSSRNATLLVESTEEQTTRLVAAGARVYAASSNAGKLFSLGDASAASGEYESPVRDTEAVSSWGKISWKASNPQLVQLFTRAGNTSAPDKTWSDWAPVDASGAPASPNARFIQWRAVLKADGSRTPSLHSVTAPYLQQNFRPEVTDIEVLPPGVALVKMQQLNASGNPVVANDPASARANARAGQQPPRTPPRRVVQKGAQAFQWTATDRNQDQLRYDVYYRGDSERTWRLLKENVEDNFYTVDSDTLPDGVYVLRVVASDVKSNPSANALTGDMESRPFTIDNTPPSVTMRQEGISGGRVRVAIEASDPTSTLHQAEVSVDAGEWRAIFPTDGITDSKNESFRHQTDVLPPGEHVIAFRIYDQIDNAGLGKLVVRIP